MNNFDYMNLTGRNLKTFLVVLEEGSVSVAAARMETTQSAISHTLDKLRQIFGDALFVRSGRGIMPTERARSLRIPVQSALDDLKRLSDERFFDPSIGSMEFTIAANDFQREILFPPIVREIQKQNIDCRLQFLPAGVPTNSLLREDRCQLVVSPFPPEGADIYHKELFQDKLVCFYDGDVRDPPTSWNTYKDCDYIAVRFPDHSSSMTALTGVDIAELKLPRITVPNFGDIRKFLKGTNLISTEMGLMGQGPLRGLQQASLPFENDILTMCMAWHQRDHTDPAHQWLRNQINSISAQLSH